MKNLLLQCMSLCQTIFQQYIKKLYAGKDADKITGAEHVNFSDALNMIGEIVNERF